MSKQSNVEPVEIEGELKAESAMAYLADGRGSGGVFMKKTEKTEKKLQETGETRGATKSEVDCIVSLRRFPVQTRAY